MTAQPLIEKLGRLIELHKSLNMLADEKREAIKQPDLRRLEILLISESGHLKAIEQLEKERLEYVRSLSLQNGEPLDKELSFEETVQFADKTDQDILLRQREQLKTEIDRLKQANGLNQQLIYQSLQFVNMNLHLIRPGEESYTYERTGDADRGMDSKQPIFDSKA